MAERRPARATIPPLKDLLYEQCGYQVPVDFTPDFVNLHGQDWDLAENDWERIIVLVLDTDAVGRRANGSEAIKQAVEAAATFLVDDELWPNATNLRFPSWSGARR
jgi:hypothetical protein